jgi:hypothetical protein
MSDIVSDPGVFSPAMYKLLVSEGPINFTSVANLIGVVCRGSLNSRLIMLLKIFGKILLSFLLVIRPHS